MKQLFSLALAAGIALAAPLAASAQSQTAPQEAQAPVPATTYRSAFAGYRPAAEDEATPDQAWRALNEKVGKAGGHMGMMKMEGHKMPMQHGTPTPTPAAKPVAQPAPQHQHEGH